MPKIYNSSGRESKIFGKPPTAAASLTPPNFGETQFRRFVLWSFGIWVFCIVVVWTFQVRWNVDEDFFKIISQSSLDLIALSLAAIGLVNELRRGKWIKKSLFVVTILFGIISLSGFWSLLTLDWEKIKDTQQIISITIVAIALLGFFLHYAVEIVARRSKKFLHFFFREHYYLIFVFIPLLLIIPRGINQITGIILSFGAGIIALLVLIAVIALSRTQESELTIVISAFTSLQPQQPPGPNGSPRLVDPQFIHEYLIENGSLWSTTHTNNLLEALAASGDLHHENGGFWLIPSGFEISKTIQNWRSRGIKESKDGTALQIAQNAYLPEEIVEAYVLPRMQSSDFRKTTRKRLMTHP